MDKNVLAKKPPKLKEGSQIDVMPMTEGTVPDKEYKPEGFKSATDFLSDMRKQYQADIDYDRVNRQMALDDKKFSAGEQWDATVLKNREGLPCLVFNTIPQFTAQLVGDWRESRKAVKVLATNNEDVDIASIRADMIRAIETQSRADRVYDSAFESVVQCGDGAFRIAVEYARDDVFDQDIFIRPIEDVHATVWDRFSVDPTGRDAKRVFVDDRMPMDEFKHKYPDIDPTVLAEDKDELQSWSSEGWVDQDSYRVTEYWRLIQREKLIGLFENGKIFQIDETNQEELIQQYGSPVRTRLAWCSYAQMHLVTAFSILSGPFEYKLSRLPIIRMTGRVINVGGRRVRHGLVRFMKDAVRMKNFNRSVAAEQIGYAPKAQWIATESAVEGREEKIRAAHLSRDPLLVVNDEAIIGQNIQRIDPPAQQTALLEAAAINSQDMKDVTGIHDASLGAKSNETSGRAILARQKEGDVAQLTFYDNGNAAVLEAGDVVNQLIPQVIDGTRTVLTIGEDQAPKLIRVNDPMNLSSPDLSVGLFQVTLSTGTSYSTKRMEAAQSLMEMIQVDPRISQIAGDLVASNLDFPGAEQLAKRLKKTVPPQFLEDDDPDKQQAPQFTPEQIQEFQQKMLELETENRELKADKTLDFKELEIKAFDAVTKRIAAMSDDAVDGENPDTLASLKVLLDTAYKIDDQEMKAADMQVRHALEEKKLASAERQADMNRASAEKAANKPTPKSPSGSPRK